MEIKKYNFENEELIDLLCSNHWPFHTKIQLDAAAIKRAIDKGYYSEGRETYWIIKNEQKVGILIIEEDGKSIKEVDVTVEESIEKANFFNLYSLR